MPTYIATSLLSLYLLHSLWLANTCMHFMQSLDISSKQLIIAIRIGPQSVDAG